MKSLLFILGCLAVGTCLAASKDNVDKLMAERLKPAGNVCIQGEDCPTATVAEVASASDGPKSGEDVYNLACVACHSSGVLGAPKFGNQEDWAPRIAQGKDTLIDHAINGFNQMPARGGNPSLSDEEVIAAIEYMIDFD